MGLARSRRGGGVTVDVRGRRRIAAVWIPRDTRLLGEDVTMPDESQAIEADGFGGLKGRTIDGDPAAVDELLARHRAATRDEADRLHVVLDQLTGPDRAILGMRTCEGLSYEEAATRLGIEPAAARRRYGRALLRLRASLLAGGQTESNL